MATKRQLQVGTLLQKEVSEVLRLQGGYIYGVQTLVTVTEVKMAPDLMLAKIYLSVYNTEGKQFVVDMITAESDTIRQALATRMRHQLRRMPTINFYLDDTLDEMYRLRGVFDTLHKDEQMGDGRTDEDYKLEGYEAEV